MNVANNNISTVAAEVKWLMCFIKLKEQHVLSILPFGGARARPAKPRRYHTSSPVALWHANSLRFSYLFLIVIAVVVLKVLCSVLLFCNNYLTIYWFTNNIKITGSADFVFSVSNNLLCHLLSALIEQSDKFRLTYADVCCTKVPTGNLVNKRLPF